MTTVSDNLPKKRPAGLMICGLRLSEGGYKSGDTIRTTIIAMTGANLSFVILLEHTLPH
jgi:hypothetical protein